MPASVSAADRRVLSRLMRLPDGTAALQLATGERLRKLGYVKPCEHILAKYGIHYFRITPEGEKAIGST